MLKTRGKSVEETGDLIQESFEAWANSIPEVFLFALRMFKYHWSYDQYLQDQARLSQIRQFSMDAVFRYVQGDGREFDYGVDIEECAIIKYFRVHDAEELVPHMCRLDYPLSNMFHRGLVRTSTLAAGGDHCDFRYKKGRRSKMNPLPGE